MFYKVICFAFLGSSLPTFMDVSWCRSKARYRLKVGNDEPKKAKQITL
jgi:hypothetical protein